MIRLIRKTTESAITVEIENGPVKSDYRAAINTPAAFLSHMIEHIVWRSGINIAVNVELDKFFLSHVVCEDLGQTLGRALARHAETSAARGYGDACAVIDEAKAHCAISLEERSYFDLDASFTLPEVVEGMASEDLKVFLDGFAQGARATVHVDIKKGENAHHIWEAAFRAFGSAVGIAFAHDEKRADMTAGVAGKIEYIFEEEH
ncbi:MAG: hypothetical protein Q4C12_08125 [Clostridia bacterium]|nr:hypothetical protein [Clostridia bacterium]